MIYIFIIGHNFVISSMIFPVRNKRKWAQNLAFSNLEAWLD